MRRVLNGVLLYFLINAATFANPDCNYLMESGANEIPVRISLSSSNNKEINGARVRIVDIAFEETIITLSESFSVEGEVAFNVELPTFGQHPTTTNKSISLLPKECVSVVGLHLSRDSYLIIEKEGFHTLSISIRELKIVNSFPTEEDININLDLVLLRKHI